MIRMRLAARIKHEKEKKAALWKELGRKAWSEDVRIEGTEEIFRSLSVLEEEMNRRQAEWQEAYGRIEALETDQENARKLRKAALDAEEEARRPLEERLTGLPGREKDLGKRHPPADDGKPGTDDPDEAEAARAGRRDRGGQGRDRKPSGAGPGNAPRARRRGTGRGTGARGM